MRRRMQVTVVHFVRVAVVAVVYLVGAVYVTSVAVRDVVVHDRRRLDLCDCHLRLFVLGAHHQDRRLLVVVGSVVGLISSVMVVV